MYISFSNHQSPFQTQTIEVKRTHSHKQRLVDYSDSSSSNGDSDDETHDFYDVKTDKLVMNVFNFFYWGSCEFIQFSNAFY